MHKQRFGRNKSFHSRPKGKKFTTAQNPNDYKNQNQLKEPDVGITQFISTLDGFSGVIKARFSDFQVNEISVDGKVAKLTDQKIPADFRTKQEPATDPPADTPLTQIPQDVWEELKKIPQSENNEATLDVTNLVKDQRAKIHEILRKYFGRKIYANTVTENEKKMMIFKKFEGKDDRKAWPDDKGEYVHFLVYKECLDTLDATLKIAHCLKMQPSNFTYAGVKDKRSKSTQWFSVRKVEPWKLIIKTKSQKNIKIGNITFKDKPLKLGDLQGNQFRIALRNVTGNDDLIERSLETLKNKGFINYYGLQRFGNDKDVPTFSIGVQLLLGNWKEACQIILKPTESDMPDFDVTKAKKVYAETGDAKKALAEFRENKNTCIEFLLLEGLSKGHSNDFVNALTSIPRNTRLLYLHSFQSLVWNFVASKRIEKFGLDAVEGDLVFLEEEETEKCDSNKEENCGVERPKVKALTPEEVLKYTIYDVILPLSGFDVIYPKHLEEFYKEILEKYGLNLEMTRQKVKEYSLSGTYRKLLGQVQDLTWKILHYDDPNCNLIRSDFEELQGREEPKDIPGGAYKALVLEFSLNSACYATMVLREILKTDTSTSAHAKLNNYHSETTETKMRTEQVEVKESEDFSEKIDLLNDTEKYEAFKNLVFGEDEPNLKRKLEDSDKSAYVKIAKVEENGS